MKNNAPDDRRTVEELISRYVLEPDLCDVFVEGETDHCVISWFLDQHDRRDWRVFTISSVDIPDALVLDCGYDVGAKGRVLTLASLLSESSDEFGSRPPILVADRDWDIDEDPPNIPLLCLLTDESSIEMYAFNEAALEKFRRLYLRTDKLTGDSIFTALLTPLVELFISRYIAHISPVQFPIISKIHSCCSISSGQVRLDKSELLRKSMIARGIDVHQFEQSIQDKIERLRIEAIHRPTRFIRGHDFVNLLSWFLRKNGFKLDLVNQEVVARVLYVTFDARILAQKPMFSELLARTEG